MSNTPIAFDVLAALFALYVAAAIWQSKDASSQRSKDSSRRADRG
ncbi:MAG TPA: hypothetical protein VMT66_10670 [Steroidobacteraceae bacterium]|nr:hypothetical protein [Steroidobacteraceae bacterium]